jgi:hypothetical protein
MEAGLRGERARWTGAVSLGACAAALAPLVVVLWRAVWRTWPEFLFHGDLATIEIAVREVLAFERPVGAYSRFGWAQPGPAGFLALAPAYLALGRASSGLVVGALSLQLASFTGALAIAWRHLGRSTTFVLALAALALQVGFGTNEIANPWPPFQTVGVVFFLLTAATAAAASRAASTLPALLAGSVAIQIHVGTAPLVVAILLTCFLLRRRAPAAPATRPRRRRALVLIVGLAAGLLWLPPLVEELGPHRIGAKRGNLSQILRTFRRGERDGKIVGVAGGWTLLSEHVDDGIDATLSTATATVPRHPPPADPRRAGRRTVTVLALLAAAGALAAWRRDRHAREMTAIAAAGLGASLFAASRIVGEPHAYLVTFLLAVVVFTLAAAATPFVRAAAARLRAANPSGTAAVAASLLLLAGAVRPAWAMARRSDEVLWLAPPPALATLDVAALAAARGAAGSRGCVRVGAIGDAWVWASGVFLALDKSGVETVSDESLTTLLGARYLAPSRDCLELRLVDRVNAEAASADGVVLASTPEVALIEFGSR